RLALVELLGERDERLAELARHRVPPVDLGPSLRVCARDVREHDPGSEGDGDRSSNAAGHAYPPGADVFDRADYSTAIVTRRLRAEPVRARDVSFERVELGGETASRPAAELRHALADRFRAVEPLAHAGADTGPSQEHVLQGDRQLLVHGVMELRDDLRIARA